MTPADPNVKQALLRWTRRLVLAAAAGIAAMAIGFVINRTDAMRAYLFGYVFWTGVGMGFLGILLLMHMVGGKWGACIRNFCEAGAATLPFMAVLLIPILLNMDALYGWVLPEARNDPLIQSKTLYLNFPFFVLRSAIYFGIFTLYIRLLSKWSQALEGSTFESGVTKLKRRSAPGFVIFIVTGSFAAIDWIMTLEPDWFSSVYGATFLVGQVLSAMLIAIIGLILWKQYAKDSELITPEYFIDLANLVLTFTALWAYLAFSQYLIIWAGDLPDETGWYFRRLNGGWQYLAIALVIFHFALPLFLLLMRDIKRSGRALMAVCLLFLAARVADVYWLVIPAWTNQGGTAPWMNFAAWIAFGALWLGIYVHRLQERSLIPRSDPRLLTPPREPVAY